MQQYLARGHMDEQVPVKRKQTPADIAGQNDRVSLFIRFSVSSQVACQHQDESSYLQEDGDAEQARIVIFQRHSGFV